MDINEVVEELKKRGHHFGPSAISHDGKVLLNVDGRLVTYDEAREILEWDKDSGYKPSA
jgi:hypothetical protein